jgi:hypothetical protein
MNLTEKQIKELLGKKNVISVKTGTKITAGINTGVEAIVVGVEQKVVLTRLRKADIVPASINSTPTDVQVVKKIKALNSEMAVVALDRTREHIPAPGGVSIGHPDVSAGTLGMWVKRKGAWGILSNNHVLGNVNQADIGDLIYQPGPADGGTEKNAKARLEVLPLIELTDASECKIASWLARILNAFARLLGSRTRLITTVAAGLNLVDCAWAQALDNRFVDPEILEAGVPLGEHEFEVGDRVKKSGRSSGLTHGTVTAVDAAINVDMGDGRIAMFADQIEIGAPGFIVPGDSGSVVLSDNNLVGGLAFAGSEDSGYANKYRHIKHALELDTVGDDE